MWLWHGTTEDNYTSIKKCRKILRSRDVDDVTDYLDLIINRAARKNIRGNCVYLCNNKETALGWDCDIRVNTNDLDINKLIAADYNKLTEIMGSTDENNADYWARQYIKSMTKFSRYIKERKNYDKVHFAEFLYFDDIVI